MTGSIIEKRSEILGGTPVFGGTRVPVRILLEHFEAGDSLEDFLRDYPTVSKQQAVDFLELVISNLPKLENEAAA